MAPTEQSASGTPSMRSWTRMGWPWGHVLASPTEARTYASNRGVIACSSFSASSWTSSHGTPTVSVRNRSIIRWRLTSCSAFSRPASVNSIVRSALRAMYPSRSSRPSISCTVGAESCMARARLAPVIGNPASYSQNSISTYSSSATVARAGAMDPSYWPRTSRPGRQPRRLLGHIA